MNSLPLSVCSAKGGLSQERINQKGLLRIKDGLSLGAAGLKWIPKVDAVQVKIPALHFGSRRRGKLDDKTTVFYGKFADLEKFVPAALSRRTVTSKFAGIFDILGKFVPVLIGLKLDLREVVRMTTSWDEPMPSDLRNKWLTNFWKLEQLRGINFHRAVMPQNAVDTKMRIITGVDAALDAMIIGCWGGCKLMDGSWSCARKRFSCASGKHNTKERVGVTNRRVTFELDSEQSLS